MNKRYKLLRDLPNAKAGEIFELGENGNLYSAPLKAVNYLFYTLEEIEEHGILNLDKGWFEEIGEEKYGGRVPKAGDKYYSLQEMGRIDVERWDGMLSYDKEVFECGNAFWTFEETEKELKHRKAYVILKEDTKGFEPSTDLTGHCYNVYYSLPSHELLIEDNGAWEARGVPCFATHEGAQASIKTHRQQWIDYLGIEEEE